MAITKEEFEQITPEQLRYSDEEVEKEAQHRCEQTISSIPTFATPAQARVAVENCARIHETISAAMRLMLHSKKPTLMDYKKLH